MALSMDEQRILAEIERQLAADDPSLAVRLSTFGRPGLAAGLRTPRGRVLASFVVVAVLALLALTAYSLIPLRVLSDRAVQGRSTAAPSPTEQAARASQRAPARKQATAGQRAAGQQSAAGQPANDRKSGTALAGRAGGQQVPQPAAVPTAGPAG
jgi:hypothetical protein